MKALALPYAIRSVNAYLLVADVARTMTFIENVFDGEVTERLATGDAVTHAQLRIGDSTVMVGPLWGMDVPKAHLYVYVDDCDRTYDKAIENGAESVMKPADMFYGDRHGGVRDADGTVWWIATHIEDVAPDELERRHAEFVAKQRKG